jgi:hypothetical protein
LALLSGWTPEDVAKVASGNAGDDFELPEKWNTTNVRPKLASNFYIDRINALIDGKIEKEKEELFVAEVLMSKVDLDFIEKNKATELDNFCNFYESKLYLRQLITH